MRVDSIFNLNNYIINNNNDDEIPMADDKNNSIFSSGNGKANGEIDVDFSQGNIGDCALLSSVYALSLTEDGAKAIKDSIKINKNKNGSITSYDVHFSGVDETYNVTQKELKEAKEYKSLDERIYSRGDDDMTVIELALEKCFKKSKNKVLRDLVDNYTTLNTEDKLNGVNPAAVSYLFMGKTVDTVIKHDDNLKKRFVPCSTYSIKDVNGKDICFEEGSEYRARGIKGDNIYINQPGDSTDIVIPVQSFLSGIYIPDIKEANDKSIELLNEFEKNSDDSMLVFATMGTEKIKNTDGKEIELFGPHAYCVSNVKDGIVTLINPHDTSKEIKIPQKNILSLEKYYFYGLEFDKEEVNQ